MSRHRDGAPTLELGLRRIRVVFLVTAAVSSLDRWSAWRTDRRLLVGVVVTIASVALANRLGTMAFRANRRQYVNALVIAAIALDVTAAIAASLVLSSPDQEASWMPFLLPVLETGLRYRLRGVVVMWGGATVTKLAIEYAGSDAIDPERFTTRAGMVLLLAISSAYLSQLLFDELIRNAARRAILDHHLHRSRTVTAAGPGMQTTDEAAATAAFLTAATALADDVQLEIRNDGQPAASAKPSSSLAETDPPTIRFEMTVDHVHVAVKAAVRPGDIDPAATHGALEQLVAMFTTSVASARRHHRLEAMQAALRHESEHDPLTGLLNRTGLARHIDALASGEGDPDRHTVLFVDLDSFKAVNDQLGHRAGDAVLIEVARRLAAATGDLGGTACRLGGDEFIVVRSDLAGEPDATQFMELLQAVLDWPYPGIDPRLGFGASVGATAFTSGDLANRVQLDEILQRADHAMYAAKRRRRVVLSTDIRAAEPDVAC